MSQEFLGARFTSSRCDRPPARRVQIVHARRQGFHLQPIENRGHYGLDKPRNGDTRGLRTGSTQGVLEEDVRDKGGRRRQHGNE